MGIKVVPHDSKSDLPLVRKNIPDDEGYDSSKEKERRRQFVREQKRKAKMRSPTVQDDMVSLGPDIVGRTEGINSRVRQSLHNYRAVKLGLFKNGDPWFGPINYHFLPGRDVTSLESLFKMISPKMDLMNGKSLVTLMTLTILITDD